jgi:solute:Na+ symporter, SSS family
LIAANSSTILTHLSWGASYLVHDFYRRFIRGDATEKHYVLMGRLATILLFILSSGLVFILDTAKSAFDIILQVGAGTGLLYLLRWFWWRINAWCEVVAMISSFLVSVGLIVLERQHILTLDSAPKLILTVIITTICWVLAAYFGPQTDRKTLVDFYRKVHPSGPGWEPIRLEAGMSKKEAESGESIPMAMVGWVAGCSMIWSALFTVGNFLYGRLGYGFLMLGVFAVSSLVLLRIVSRLWSGKDEAEYAEASTRAV